MCRYLHHQEASLDLTNYAGITAAMAAQSTNQDRILDLIGKPLEGSRPLDGSLLVHSSRKVNVMLTCLWQVTVIFLYYCTPAKIILKTKLRGFTVGLMPPNMWTEVQMLKTLIRLLLEKQFNASMHCLPSHMIVSGMGLFRAEK